MREIKFRLIKDRKIVGYERHIQIDGIISIMHTPSLAHAWKFIYPDYKHWISHDSKEQFTGLRDKNGKGREVWKGDRYRGVESGTVFTVAFQEGAFILTKEVDYTPRPIKHCDLHYAIYNLDIEYLGNIHENPELSKD